MNYQERLDRAFAALPERSAEQRRLDVPDAVAQPDGAFTRLMNIGGLADALGREPEHLHRFVQGELGTSGQFDGDRGRYSGSFSGGDFDAAVRAYIEEYVRCSECGLPDTRLTTEGRNQMLRCEACGAFRPVEKRSAPAEGETAPTVEEGETYEVTIVGTGREGDGVAERGEYRIFVPGATEGQVVRAYIESVSGTLAFASPVR